MEVVRYSLFSVCSALWGPRCKNKLLCDSIETYGPYYFLVVPLVFRLHHFKMLDFSV